MTTTAVLGLTAAILIGSVGVARADVWDTGTTTDGAASTPNEVVTGSDQVHDLLGGSPDQDWYRLRVKPYASYEILIESVSGKPTAGLTLARFDSDGMTALPTTGGPIGTGLVQSYRFENTATTATANYLKVSGNCGGACSASDTYRIRFYDTSYAIARFNNSATQVTTLMIQNRSEFPITITGRFFSTSGGTPLTLPNPWMPTIGAHGSIVVDTTGPALQLSSKSGSVLITSSSGRYGDLTGKAVAVEPATGFSFDTFMEPAR
jgi:hypothetical protein